MVDRIAEAALHVPELVNVIQTKDYQKVLALLTEYDLWIVKKATQALDGLILSRETPSEIRVKVLAFLIESEAYDIMLQMWEEPWYKTGYVDPQFNLKDVSEMYPADWNQAVIDVLEKVAPIGMEDVGYIVGFDHPFYLSRKASFYQASATSGNKRSSNLNYKILRFLKRWL